MSKNRLDLNFKLLTKEERTEFARSYLDKITFTPTSEELDTIAKYILWGKDSVTGLNGRQEGLELETRYKTWDAQKVESLEGLFESQNFSEMMIRSPLNPPTKPVRQVFSRADTRKTAPPHLLSSFEELWRQIDEVDLLINFYELEHNKRKNPPRAQLLNRFTSPELSKLRERAKLLTSYKYLKLKHELVMLRRQQYTLKDEYAPIIQGLSTFSIPVDPPTFGEEISVLPIGIPSNNIQLYEKIFNTSRLPIPSDFSEEELKLLSKFLWEKPETTKHFFDFRNTDHLYELYNMWELLEDEAQHTSLVESNLKLFLRAATMYRTLANLDPILEDILNLKIQKKTNQQILEVINSKYNKTYQANYISTLYCKKCLARIAKAASRHREVLENCFFPENFKACKDCGKVLLIDEENFMRRGRSKDGFSVRCKKCEKAVRDRRKETIKK